MTFQDETERERRRKSETDGQGGGDAPAKPRRRKGQSADVGDALRSVYQRAVNEDIPPDLLDLLGKLD